MNRTQIVLSLLLNLFVAVSVLGCCLLFFLRAGKGNMQRKGVKALAYFTVDSNLLCALACLGVCVWDASALLRGQADPLPRWLDLCKLAGTAAVGVTFLTTLCYLLPISHFHFGFLYGGRNLFLHALCPLAAAASWTLCEQSEALPFVWALLGLVPTALYALIYMRQVLVTKRWDDFYKFNRGGKWPLASAAMLLLSFAVSVALWALRCAV